MVEVTCPFRSHLNSVSWGNWLDEESWFWTQEQTFVEWMNQCLYSADKGETWGRANSWRQWLCLPCPPHIPSAQHSAQHIDVQEVLNEWTDNYRMMGVEIFFSHHEMHGSLRQRLPTSQQRLHIAHQTQSYFLLLSSERRFSSRAWFLLQPSLSPSSQHAEYSPLACPGVIGWYCRESSKNRDVLLLLTGFSGKASE